MENAIALRVKIADVSHNLDLGRIPNPTAKDLQRIEKYKKVLSQLCDRQQTGSSGSSYTN